MSGVGLHTGAQCTMTFKPAPENCGIKFVRIDLGGCPEIPAIADNVVDISRGTTIGIGDARVHTVEHVLAAVAGLQIDNIIIEIDGIEPPIGDGSAMPYVEILLKAGIEQQKAPKDYLIIDETVQFHNEDGQVDIVALPLDSFRVTVMVDYQNPALGSQHSGLFDLEKEFINEFAPEHIELLVNDELEIIKEINNAGLILIGDNTPSSASDYCLGSNHVLPTNQFAKSRSSLSVLDFIKIVNTVEIDYQTLEQISPILKEITSMEGLSNHYEAVKGRIDNELDK
jgi:UDP-3-O-[3-hydroxymyristoyl] N-acetylglucosamine deacetylase/3-hydroxyacyl-[acyl-carrier-protein] dehydratase